MNNTELNKGDSVEVTGGMWKGVTGTVEDVHAGSSVIRIRDLRGETAYALKEDVKRV